MFKLSYVDETTGNFKYLTKEQLKYNFTLTTEHIELFVVLSFYKERNYSFSPSIYRVYTQIQILIEETLLENNFNKELFLKSL